MKTRSKVLLFLFLAGMVVCAGGVYYAFLRDVDAVDNKLATGTPAPDSVLYGIDIEQSELAFVIKANAGDVNASFKMTGGVIELKPEGDGSRVVVNLILDGDTVDAGNDLINYGLKFGLEVEKYPYGIFTGESQEIISDYSQTQTITLVGSLELHGVTNPKTVTAEVRTEGKEIFFTSQTEVDMTEFDAGFPESIGSNVLDATITLVGSEDIAPSGEPTSEAPASEATGAVTPGVTEDAPPPVTPPSEGDIEPEDPNITPQR